MKKAKGVKKNVVENNINIEDYKKCLTDSVKYRHKMKTFRSINHQLFTLEQNKISLSSYDDKRYILEDGISTLPYGHYSLSL